MKTPFVLGLTGSIGMGKSTTAAMFAARGIPVWDADATVHRLYAPGGAAALALAALTPEAIVDGAVSRPALRSLIQQDPGLLDRINAIVHPLVAQDRHSFLSSASAPLLVLDVPLLFETGSDALCDAVAVVSVPQDVQRARVLARAEMSEADFQTILARQMPDSEKRARARWVIHTSTHETARAQVDNIIAEATHA
jgi:dephospho-CoA kinase